MLLKDRFAVTINTEPLTLWPCEGVIRTTSVTRASYMNNLAVNRAPKPHASKNYVTS
jgi:hypothetical protein